MAKDAIIIGAGSSSGGGGSGDDPTDAKTVEGWAVQEADEGDTTAGTNYYGKTRESGIYRIDRLVESGDSFSIRFASRTNNPTHTTFTTAWTNRATLTYDYLESV